VAVTSNSNQIVPALAMSISALVFSLIALGLIFVKIRASGKEVSIPANDTEES